MTPFNERVVLQIEILPEEHALFGETQKKPKVTLIALAPDCKNYLGAYLNKEVVFNGTVSEILEETAEYKRIVTHQTNLLIGL